MRRTTPHTDAELLARHVDGDPEAFGELVRRHRDRLWAVALRTSGDREDAADALQDALISAFRKADAFRGDAAVTTWLHRIVVNACLDRTRRRTAHPTVPLPESDAADHMPRTISDPMAHRAEALDVTEALARLPPEQRAALVLVDMEGYSIEEASHMLDAPPGTIKSRCARGRARLAPLLTDIDGSRDAGAGGELGGEGGGHDRPAGPQGNRPPAGRVPSREARTQGGEGET